MIRTFQPVGQGAFYTEDFGNFKIVYDCGSGTDQKIIVNNIKTTFEEKEVIDAVFISHLHQDHVNGLEFLLKHCDVRKLFLPLLSPIGQINIFLQNHILGFQSLLVERLIFEEIALILQEFESLEIIYIPETPEGFENNFESEPILLDDNKIRTKIQGNSRFCSSRTPDWTFIPFNFRQKSRSTELTEKLGGIKIDTIEDFKKLWEDDDDKKKIIDAYNTVPGSMNTNSMTLYSGPELRNGSEFYMSLIHPCSRFNCCYCKIDLVGCVYFGDFAAKGNLKWKQFVNFYRKYWDIVGTVQIPHHGSRHNYNPEINRSPKFSIISAGYKNSYGHPHISTLKEILLCDGKLHIVNEFSGSLVMFEIKQYPLSRLRYLKLKKISKSIKENHQNT